jgi:hypothetical protein
MWRRGGEGSRDNGERKTGHAKPRRRGDDERGRAGDSERGRRGEMYR